MRKSYPLFLIIWIIIKYFRFYSETGWTAQIIAKELRKTLVPRSHREDWFRNSRRKLNMNPKTIFLSHLFLSLWPFLSKKLKFQINRSILSFFVSRNAVCCSRNWIFPRAHHPPIKYCLFLALLNRSKVMKTMWIEWKCLKTARSARGVHPNRDHSAPRVEKSYGKSDSISPLRLTHISFEQWSQSACHWPAIFMSRFAFRHFGLINKPFNKYERSFSTRCGIL
jgi:hypothetical protein